ncbi:MAG: penicillin-binding protein 2 [Deltaproteobacteria bacterium]|nr:penicillin-binding protein 2 [Deltaproteobacteria bacterium]
MRRKKTFFFKKKKKPPVKPPRGALEPAESPEVRASLKAAVVVVCLCFLVLIGRLWYLQLLQGEHFRSLSENNRIRLVDIPPSRGLIFDTKGRLLADNRPAFTLAVIPEDVDNWPRLTRRLEHLVGVTPEEMQRARESSEGGQPFKPVRIRSHLDRHQLAVLETFRYELPGVKVLVEYRRAYLAALETAHAVGYLGEINKEELEAAPKSAYRMGDFVGRYGLERSRERVLHGRRGARQVEVDAMGRELTLLEEIPPEPGANLILTLNLDLQQAAAKALEGQAGAVVALNPQNGQVYCLYSAPSFDQNTFITGMTDAQWKELSTNERHPLKDRAISGMYPPGSTYKIVTAAAGLGEKVITPAQTIFCGGQISLGRRSYKCWAVKKGGHGSTELHKAIRESCDVYFYRVGQRVGVDRLAQYAGYFGLGKKTGIPLPHESVGLVPTSDWKRKRFGEPWQEGETFSIAIGQGFNLATPLQLARMVAVVANRGMLVTPTLVKAVVPADGSGPIPESEAIMTKVPIDPGILDQIASGLVAVCNEPHGTGSLARLKQYTVAGKTGTAQVVGLKVEKGFGRASEVPWKYRDHALFVAYAPAENPTIALAVVVEHGGHGGSAAGPVAAQVLRAYFGLPDPAEEAAAKKAAAEAAAAASAAATAAHKKNKKKRAPAAPPVVAPASPAADNGVDGD